MLCLAAACQADAVATLLTCAAAASGDANTVSKSLHVLRSLLAVDSCKDAFMRAGGASHLAELLSHESSKLAAFHGHVTHGHSCVTSKAVHVAACIAARSFNAYLPPTCVQTVCEVMQLKPQQAVPLKQSLLHAHFQCMQLLMGHPPL